MKTIDDLVDILTLKKEDSQTYTDQPNKKHYDPRKWLREGEITFKTRLKKAFEDLNNVDTL